MSDKKNLILKCRKKFSKQNFEQKNVIKICLGCPPTQVSVKGLKYIFTRKTYIDSQS